MLGLTDYPYVEIVVVTLATYLLVTLLRALFASPAPKANNSRFKSTKKIDAVKPKEMKEYSKEEIAKHNHTGDCWLIIKNKVYDMTRYVDEHPGLDAIANNAGADSTEGFYGDQHPSHVFQFVDEFCIGWVEGFKPE